MHQSDTEPGTRIKEGYRLKAGREDKHEVHSQSDITGRPVGSSRQPDMCAPPDPDGSEKLLDLVCSDRTVTDRKAVAVGKGEER